MYIIYLSFFSSLTSSNWIYHSPLFRLLFLLACLHMFIFPYAALHWPGSYCHTPPHLLSSPLFSFSFFFVLCPFALLTYIPLLYFQLLNFCILSPPTASFSPLPLSRRRSPSSSTCATSSRSSTTLNSGRRWRRRPRRTNSASRRSTR